MDYIDRLPLPDLTYKSWPARREIKSWGLAPFKSEAQIREEMAKPYLGVERRHQPWKRRQS